jgi:uncharacterized peroxidase-related enzyme
MTRDDERRSRAQEEPIVGGLPDVPGIGVAMRLKPELGVHLRGLADELLVNEFAGATISRFEREVIATAVSAANDCFFCMDSHAAHATAVGELHGETGQLHLLETVKVGSSDGFSPKMQALLAIARTVQEAPRTMTAADVDRAKDAGASDADIQLAVLIAAGFSMYNRLVDGFRARTPPSTEMYVERASEIAKSGYSAPSMVPGASNPARS